MVDFGCKVSATLGRKRIIYWWLNNRNRIKAFNMNNIFIHKVKLSLLFSVLFIGKQLAFAYVPNTFWANPGENDFYIELDKVSFPSNRAGTITPKIIYSMPIQYYPIYYLNHTNSKCVRRVMRMETDLPASNNYPRALSVNEYLDVRIHPYENEYSTDLTNSTIPVNWVDLIGDPCLHHEAGRTSDNVGNRGTLFFILRKDIIGGSVLLDRDTVLTSAYLSIRDKQSDRLSKNPLPVFRLILKAQTFPVPVECSIQTDRRDVDFKDLNSADITLDGSRYGQELQLTYRCNTPRNLPIKVDMIADNSSFSSNYIATSNPNLGIVMKHGGKTVKPQNSFNSTLVNGTGSDRIYVAPVKNPTAKTIATGDFTASAVLVLSIQ